MGAGVEVVGRAAELPAGDVLDPARDLLLVLERHGRSAREQVLEQRRQLARAVHAGEQLRPRPETEHLRADDTWQVAAPPAELQVRQVELSTAATPENARTALASGADVWVADLEDTLVPTWEHVVTAHRVVGEVVRQHVPQRPVVMVRPRGLHLPEAHLLVDGAAVTASVADVALFLAGQAQRLLGLGSAPYLYLPKIESHAEAQWWESLLCAAEEHLGLPAQSVRVSVLVETVSAAYELEEILHALRGRITGLAAGRWDYIFSHLRTYGPLAGHVLPDLESFTMNTRFLRTYTDLIVRTCHRRGAQAIGGPVALVPGGPFDDITLRAQARLTRDKSREAREGFDGAWVLHPAQVPIARAPFAAEAEHGSRQRPTGAAVVDGAALADVSGIPGSATLSGLRSNLRAALTYLTGWLAGEGSAVIDGHLQDFGTVELARLQTWQWVHHRVRLAEGPEVGELLLGRMVAEEVAILRRRVGESAPVALAEQLLVESILTPEPPAFLSLQAYQVLVDLESGRLAPGSGGTDSASAGSVGAGAAGAGSAA